MTEHPRDSGHDDTGHGSGAVGGSRPDEPRWGQEVHAATERTGLPAVDAVIEAVESVGELPVADQVRVYEGAHEQLRRALDG